MDGLRSLGDVMRESLDRPDPQNPLRDRSLVQLWPQVVGQKVAEATRVASLRDGVLLVVARSSAWACELTFFKDAYVRGLNERLGEQRVQDIRYRVGEVPGTVRRREGAEPAAASGDPEPSQSSLPPEARADVERIAAPVADPQVRSRLEGVLVREVRRREWRKRQGWKPCARCRTLHPAPTAVCPLCAIERRR